jgi:hypothetical protein
VGKRNPDGPAIAPERDGERRNISFNSMQHVKMDSYLRETVREGIERLLEDTQFRTPNPATPLLRFTNR